MFCFSCVVQIFPCCCGVNLISKFNVRIPASCLGKNRGRYQVKPLALDKQRTRKQMVLSIEMRAKTIDESQSSIGLQPSL